MKAAGRRRIHLPIVVLAAFTSLASACSDDDSTDVADSAAGTGGGGRADATSTGGSAGTTTGGAGGSSGSRLDAASDARDAAADVPADVARDATADVARDAQVDAAREASSERAVDARADVAEAGGDAARDAVTDCGVAGPLAPPNVTLALQPPTGANLARRFHAVGTQIYTCTGSADGGADGGSSFAWVLKAPAAVLYDDSCAGGGTHFAGPTWQSADGSSVVGAAVARADAAGAIPWLLLRAVTNTGEGIFSNVSAIQRVDTVGGVAPATGCDATTLATDRAVPYTATYYFYTGGTWPVAEAGADAEAGAAGGDAATDAADDGG